MPQKLNFSWEIWGKLGASKIGRLAHPDNVTYALEVPKSIDERKFTPEELAQIHKLHPSTIRKLFVDEPGVIRLGHAGLGRRRQYFTLRIPASVAERVFRNMTVGAGAGS